MWKFNCPRKWMNGFYYQSLVIQLYSKYSPICQWAYSTKEKKANSSQVERGLQTKKKELIKGIFAIIWRILTNMPSTVSSSLCTWTLGKSGWFDNSLKLTNLMLSLRLNLQKSVYNLKFILCYTSLGMCSWCLLNWIDRF